MTLSTLYPPTTLFNRRTLLEPVNTFLKPVSIEFHETLASLGMRLWQMIPQYYKITSHSKRDGKAWEETLTQIKEMVNTELPNYGYTSCRWDEQFDRTFITPLRDGKSIPIKKKYNVEHYKEERANLEKFRARIELLLVKNVPLIYSSHLHWK